MLFPFSILSIKLMNKVAKRIFYTSYFSAVWIIIIPLDSQKVGITSSKARMSLNFSIHVGKCFSQCQTYPISLQNFKRRVSQERGEPIPVTETA